MPRTIGKLLLIIGFTGSALAQPGSPPDIGDRFVGMWRLASWTVTHEDGTTRQSPRSVSYIVYTTDRMCWVAMDPNRPLWASRTDPTDAEIVSAFRGFGAYCAAVEVNAAEGYVLHHVEIERSPNAVGVTRKRSFNFDGPDRLILSVDPSELSPPVVDNTLVWERVKE